ncbi:DUF5667 domain-containing protein [Neobacillus sp. YIM B06451]|uniref:DUF5667 domain-containing protein n=1 Tax=Neobacillus sp. YIM B06451 TaxID=3070994 RepID=UPI00292D5677|nr:DUF5667 domain-containing protein [Neobacillus sp. YIM B06451]
MKKFVFTAALAATLAFGTTASASAELEGTAGTTPDQFLYSFDQLFEDLRLFFTFDSEKEASLLMEFAKERLAEAALMTTSEKTEFVSGAVADYVKLLESAKETVSEVIADEDASDELKEELTNKLEETAELDEVVEGQLEEEELEEAAKVIDDAYLVANVVKGFDTETVKELRTKEFGYGEITKIISLSELSGKTIEELTALLAEQDIDEVMADLGVTMNQIKSIVLDKKIAYLENSLAEAGENENSKQVKKLEKKLSVLTAKKERFAARDEEKEDDGQESETPAESGETTDGEQAEDNGGTPAPANEEQTGSGQGTSGEETSNDAASDKVAETADNETTETLTAASALSKKEIAVVTSSVAKKEKPAKQTPDTVKKDSGTGKASGTVKKESASAKNEKENVKAQPPSQTATETDALNKKANEPAQKEKAAEESKKPADSGQKGKETSEQAKEEKTKDEAPGGSDKGQQQKPEKEAKEEKSEKENAKQKGGK